MPTFLTLGHIYILQSFFLSKVEYVKIIIALQNITALFLVLPTSFLLCSGADYYDYGHGLSEETYDSYGK